MHPDLRPEPDNLDPKSIRYEPKWERDIDFHPDRNPSGRRIFLCDDGYWMLEVAGLGVMVIQAGVLTEEADSMTPHIRVAPGAMCSFTDEQIRRNEL